MSELIPIDEFERKTAKQHAVTVASLRTLADRLERLRDWKLREALPLAASAVNELERRLAPWLRQDRA